jgi:PTH1 family peptidyl-tRNA hydrolase
MKCIVWLGNPGSQYKNTRHNVGFFLLDQFVQKQNFPDWKDSRFQAVISEGSIDGEKVILIKPMTYMNLSGQAIQSLLSYYKLNPQSDLLIISDDIDMTFAKLRMRSEWSHGGQNGLKDTINRLGTDAFSRIKVGIGRHEHMSVSDWVLSSFAPEELAILSDEVYPKVEQYILDWIHHT